VLGTVGPRLGPVTVGTGPVSRPHGLEGTGLSAQRQTAPETRRLKHNSAFAGPGAIGPFRRVVESRGPGAHCESPGGDGGVPENDADDVSSLQTAPPTADDDVPRAHGTGTGPTGPDDERYRSAAATAADDRLPPPLAFVSSCEWLGCGSAASSNNTADVEMCSSKHIANFEVFSMHGPRAPSLMGPIIYHGMGPFAARGPMGQWAMPAPQLTYACSVPP